MAPSFRSLRAILLVALGIATPTIGHSADFAAGSLIIPMDTVYQDFGMLKAFGLVHRLLSVGIPVNQVIQPGKAQGGVDFAASAEDVQTSAVITNHGYRGGPFIIDATHGTDALAVIGAWHGDGNVTTVHAATSPFSGNVARTLVDPPAIAVFADGNELIAFNNLNAAGIPDGAGQPWPVSVDLSRVYAGYPDILSAAEIAGPSGSGLGDGALFKPDVSPAYCHLVSMHWSIALDDEVVREVRLWLDWGPDAHLFLQCVSITAFENAANGKFLSPLGFQDDGATPNPLKAWIPDHPFAQFDGPIVGDAGTVNSIGLMAGSFFYPSASVMIEEDRGQSTPNQIQMLSLSGYLDGNTGKGRITCLGGHNYATAVPVSANAQTNGVRLFLNSMFDPTCTPTGTVSIDRSPGPQASPGIRIWNAPEPFPGSTRIHYVLRTAGDVDVSVFDVHGRLVRRLFSGHQDPGLHDVSWDGRLGSGGRAVSDVYWVRVETTDASGTKRISLFR